MQRGAVAYRVRRAVVVLETDWGFELLRKLEATSHVLEYLVVGGVAGVRNASTISDKCSRLAAVAGLDTDSDARDLKLDIV